MVPSESETPFTQRGLVAGRYELVRLIGQGGMGEVWEARHLELDAPVAIKFAIERRLRDKSCTARFRKEACALAKLRFPNIVQVFDIGVHESFPFMVMELLKGETLRARLERTERLRVGEAANIIDSIALALAVIHEAGMVHRDVTPANVFLLENVLGEGLGGVKLLDFGIVKEMDSETRVTVSGVVVGSPSYMSPEQARAEAVDKRSDLWSLGALTYRAITGKDPFAGSCMTDVLLSICTGDIPKVGPSFLALETDLDTFFSRALARNPTHRFPSALTMAKEFRRIASLDVNDQPTVGSFDSTSSTFRYELGRSATTADVHPNPMFAGRAVQRKARKRYAVGAAFAGMLICGAVAGYGYARWTREGAPTPRATLEPTTPPAATPNGPTLLSEAIPPPPDAGSPDTAPAASVNNVGALPSARPRSTKARPLRSHDKEPVDPVFGLPVE